MALVKFFAVVCDRCGVRATPGVLFGTSKDARSDARKQRFKRRPAGTVPTRRKSLDLCDPCSARKD